MAKKIITQQLLKAILDYSPITGAFTWKVEKTGRARKGSIAGYSRKHKDHPRYRFIGINGTQYREHRLAWLYVYGAFPKHQIDHEDGDVTNNIITNLREVSNQTNSKNQSKPKNNTSGYIGVSWSKRDGRWVSYIYINCIRKHLGNFINKNDAVRVRLTAEFKYGFHSNHGR